MNDGAMEYTEDFLNKIQPKKKIRLVHNNTNSDLLHILAIVDDDMVVVKKWGKHRQRWFYQVESLYYFWLYYENKKLKAG